MRPRIWKDPFESYIMNATGHLADGARFKVGFREHFYAQCWSLRRESDAQWRIYAQREDGVKVRTTIERLFSALYAYGGPYRDISCFIGRVKYYRSATLRRVLQNGGVVSKWILDSSGRGQARTLCFKRMQFNYEREVRLIYNSQGGIEGDFFHVPVDPNDLFDEVVFDPRMNQEEFEKNKATISELGFTKKIIQSGLYKIPKLHFTLQI